MQGQKIRSKVRRVHIPYNCFKIITFLLYINFLLFNIAHSPLFNINLSLPNINILLRPRFHRMAVPTTSSTAYFNTLI